MCNMGEIACQDKERCVKAMHTLNVCVRVVDFVVQTIKCGAFLFQ